MRHFYCTLEFPDADFEEESWRASALKNTSAVARTPSQNNSNSKLDSLEPFRSDATNQALTTNQGVKVSDNQNTLKAGPRGPSLLEDFIMREKSRTSITSGFLSGSCMHAAQPRMACSSHTRRIRI